MLNLLWHLLAKLLARPAVATWLINLAQRTPYQHIVSAERNKIGDMAEKLEGIADRIKRRYQ